jgi:hypothetical protein
MSPTGLFPGCDHQLDRAMGQLFLFQHTDTFQQRCQSGLVIGSQNSRAIRHDILSIHFRVDTFPRRHRIHMAGEVDFGSLIDIPFQRSDKVAGTVPRFGGGIVLHHIKPQTGQLFLEQVANFPLFSGLTIRFY